MAATEHTRTDEHTSEERSATLHITLSRSLILKILSALIVLFVVAHMAFSINRYVVKASFFAADNLYVVFDLWAEASIPTWYSIALLLVCSALLALVAVAKRREGDRYARHWLGLTLIFLTLSIDDAADLHGQTSYTLQAMFETGGFLAYAWVIPAAVACVVVGIAYLRFLVDLPAAIRWRFVLAGTLFVSGALGMEMVQASYDTRNGVENMPYRIMVAIEESLEMAGIVLFIGALLSYLSDTVGRVEIRVHV